MRVPELSHSPNLKPIWSSNLGRVIPPQSVTIDMRIKSSDITHLDRLPMKAFHRWGGEKSHVIEIYEWRNRAYVMIHPCFPSFFCESLIWASCFTVCSLRPHTILPYSFFSRHFWYVFFGLDSSHRSWPLRSVGFIPLKNTITSFLWVFGSRHGPIVLFFRLSSSCFFLAREWMLLLVFSTKGVE